MIIPVVQKEETKETPRSTPRLKFSKRQLLAAFELSPNIDFNVFEKSCLTDHIELFNNDKPLAPENETKTDEPSGSMQSKPRPPKPNVYQDAEDEDDDPIWVDFDPKKEEKFNFADRAIPNEDELRKKNKDQQNNWSKPKRDPKIEDKLDEIMLLQM